ncbi:hypothetical protein BpHYR1_000496 [Brachionus plicatilis]|uniref:Uncharacterized protein n=1 Tax=Brachionus plicatilis TaxID=10195 RepID=A0A3M7QMT0_BRAPC|nr:hypothetical protein BpHYR1_000496 [Brachionus plicatilis]
MNGEMVGAGRRAFGSIALEKWWAPEGGLLVLAKKNEPSVSQKLKALELRSQLRVKERVVRVLVKNRLYESMIYSCPECDQVFTKKCDHILNFQNKTKQNLNYSLCFFDMCNLTPFSFFINSPQMLHSTAFDCLLNAYFAANLAASDEW